MKGAKKKEKTTKQNKTKKKQAIGQLDGTFQVLTWKFNRCLNQNEARWKINNCKINIRTQQIPGLHKEPQDLS